MRRVTPAALLVATLAALSMMAVPHAVAQDDTTDVEEGRQLYLISCSTCHGVDGEGGIAPALVGTGAAGTSFMLTTGRMPLAETGTQAVRKPPAFTEEEIDQLVAFVASLGPGPAIPDVRPDEGTLSEGTSLYIENCAACHSSGGAGGALPHGIQAPSLHQATATQIGEAIRIGPGAMPDFSENVLSEHEMNSIAAYVLELQDTPNPGGLPLGLRGPVTEGVVAWVVGIVLLVLVTMWIERFRARADD